MMRQNYLGFGVTISVIDTALTRQIRLWVISLRMKRILQEKVYSILSDMEPLLPK